MKKPKYLIIDDEQSSLDLISEWLAIRGIESVGCLRFEEAEKLNLSEFTVIVIDILMPGETGIEWVRRHRNLNADIFLMSADLEHALENIGNKTLFVDGLISKQTLIEDMDWISHGKR